MISNDIAHLGGTSEGAATQRPLLLVAGQEHTDAVTAELLHAPGTVVIEHRFDGQVVCRRMIMLQHGVVTTAQTPLELAHEA